MFMLQRWKRDGEMARMSPKQSQEELLRDITIRAEALWGAERASAIRATLEQTARQLQEVGQTLPERDVEPGFYQ